MTLEIVLIGLAVVWCSVIVVFFCIVIFWGAARQIKADIHSRRRWNDFQQRLKERNKDGPNK